MTTWAEAIKASIERSLDGLHTSIPAEVTDYLPLLQQCSVAPVIDGMPELHDVPVAWPRGGGHTMYMPLEAGDSVLLIFCEQDFGPWRLLGSAQAPAILRRHGLFAYAIPGAATDLAPLLSPSILSGSYLGEDGPGGTVVNVDSGVVNLGVFPFIDTLVSTLKLQTIAGPALITALQSACTAAIAAGVPNDGGKAAFGAFSSALGTALASWPGSVGSSVVNCSG